MKNKIIINSLLGATLLCSVLITSCSDNATDSTPTQTELYPISFSTDVEQTRATTGSIDNLNALKMVSEGFGVIAYLTDENTWTEAKGSYEGNDAAYPAPDYMYNQQVTWGWMDKQTYNDGSINWETSKGDWIYSPLKYWPNTTKNATNRYISFFAYAPFIERAAMGSYGITDMTKAEDKSPFLVYKLDTEHGTNQIDLLWSDPKLDAKRNGEGLIYFEGDPAQEKWQKVPLNFHHTMAALEVYVMRVYDEPTGSGKKPAAEEHTKLLVSELQLKGIDNTTTKGLFSGGRLNLETGKWGSDGTWAESTSVDPLTLTYSEQNFVDVVRGTKSTEPLDIRNYELNKWEGDSYGVDEEERLLMKDGVLTLLPTGGEVTITPSLTYSMITRDDELLLSTLTDKDGHKYARIVNSVEGNSQKLNIERGKKYKIVIRIGVEHVEFEVVSVTDWDFPMRFNPNVDSTTEQEITHTINED